MLTPDVKLAVSRSAKLFIPFFELVQDLLIGVARVAFEIRSRAEPMPSLSWASLLRIAVTCSGDVITGVFTEPGSLPPGNVPIPVLGKVLSSPSAASVTQPLRRSRRPEGEGSCARVASSRRCECNRACNGSALTAASAAALSALGICSRRTADSSGNQSQNLSASETMVASPALDCSGRSETMAQHGGPAADKDRVLQRVSIFPPSYPVASDARIGKGARPFSGQPGPFRRTPARTTRQHPFHNA